jgi:chromosome condensin MukBEF complex kleisin-like MukF subunit
MFRKRKTKGGGARRMRFIARNLDGLEEIYREIRDELKNATSKFGSFHNAHEAYAVLLEEVDELWDNIKLNQRTENRTELIKEEAIQVAAMAIRLIYDCCNNKKEAEREE